MAGVAQSVERQIVALEVASSKLVARPIILSAMLLIGVSPSGKARDFDSRIRRFKSCHPSQTLKSYGPLAQLAEHLTFNQGVPGSSLGWTTTKNAAYLAAIYAPLAQLVEQLTLNQWAQGSSP